MTNEPAVDPYLIEHVQHALAHHDDCGVLGLSIRVLSGRVFISGTLSSDACRALITEIAEEVAGDMPVVNETVVATIRPPEGDNEVLA